MAAQSAAWANIPVPGYTAELQRRIKRSWFPRKGDEFKVVVVLFTLDFSGRVTKLKVEKSSGSRTADEAALRAVKLGAPFKPLPEGSPAKMTWQYTFDATGGRALPDASPSTDKEASQSTESTGKKPPAAATAPDAK